MNVVFIVPTGLGAEIGGHSGDATPAAKLIASVSDKLFTHPNVLNASDINEMAENMLYIEGSILNRFLQGEIGLKEVYNNKILVVVNKPIKNETINAVSAARTTIGADISILELNVPIKMKAFLNEGVADGFISGADQAIEQLSVFNFDVLVVNTPIDVKDDDVSDYLKKEGGVNIWGGVEANLSKFMSKHLNKPVIHSPVENNEFFKSFNEIVDPRKSAELVSMCYLHCCLKGAHKAPKISTDKNSYTFNDIDFLVSPFNIFGIPHYACLKNNITTIFVKENKTVLNVNNKNLDNSIIVENYLEAAGVISAKKAGITIESIKRPLFKTNIKGELKCQ